MSRETVRYECHECRSITESSDYPTLLDGLRTAIEHMLQTGHFVESYIE